jgi:hypothetical protein
MALALNGIIHIHVHQLEHKSESAGWLVTTTHILNNKNLTYYSTSYNLIIWGCGLSLLSAYISLRLLTCSMVSKWFFMHLIATYFPVLMLWALSTSENVPSPFLEIKRYSTRIG